MQLSQEEESYFRYLWGILDPQGIGSANARDTVQFFKRSQLPSDKLKNIWLLSVTNNENKLYPNEFYTALKYIALSQNGFELHPQLLETRQIRLPVLDGIPPPPEQQQQISKPPTASMYQTTPVTSSYQPQLVQQAQQFSQSQFEIPSDQLEKYTQYYLQQDKQQQGFIDGETARNLFQKSGLTVQILTELWALVDTGHKGFLYKYEYIVAVHLISLCRRNIPLPTILPESLQKLIQQSQPQQSVIINEIKPQLSQGSRVPSTNASELPGLQQQSLQLQNQLTQLVQQLPNYSNNNAQKQALENKQKELDFYIDQVNRLQVLFDSLKQQEIDLKNEIEKINATKQQQQPKQPILTQQVVNSPKVDNFNNYPQLYPPLQSEAPYKQQQVNLTLDDGFNQYKQQQTEEVPW